MIAVTIAVGDGYHELAVLAVESCRAMTGLYPVVINDTGDCQPAKFKLRLLEMFRGETVLYFDADARFLRPWNVCEFENLSWPVVVLDWPTKARDADCAAFEIDPTRYFASGFWIANQRHAAVWTEARQIVESPRYETRFKYEQTALNTAIQRARLPLTILDRRYWWIPTVADQAPLDAVAVALGGGLNGPNRPSYDAAIRRATA